MQLSMGSSLCLSLQLGETIMLSHSFGENSGDIPLYSLHKICSRWRRNPPTVSKQLRQILKGRLFQANRVYRNESGRHWNCLTSLNLVWAIEETDEDVKRITTGQGAIPAGSDRDRFARLFDEYRAKAVSTIQQWFSMNFNDLLYTMDGKIPWAVVQRLQRNLGDWATSGKNPFYEGIEDMILDIAKENGITDPENAEDAWQRLGGILFK